jgi:hypothetical protein
MPDLIIAVKRLEATGARISSLWVFIPRLFLRFLLF